MWDHHGRQLNAPLQNTTQSSLITEGEWAEYLDVLSLEVRHWISKSATHIHRTHRFHVLGDNLVAQTDAVVVLHTDTKHPTMRPLLGMLICHKYGGKGDPMGMVISRVSEFIQVVYIKPLDICYDFAAVSHLSFWQLPFGEGVPRGTDRQIVLLGTAMVCCHRLSLKTTIVSGTVWPQFVM